MKYILPCMVIGLIVAVSSASAQSNLGSFTNNKIEKVDSNPAVKLAYLNASISNDRVLLNWAIENNKETDRFEVERSTDGKSFKTAALVFGSELTELAEYSFFEKAKKAKTYYRLKLIYKNNRTEYSDIIIP